MTGAHTPWPESWSTQKNDERAPRRGGQQGASVSRVQTCLGVIDAPEVADEEVARDDDAGVSQHVDQEADEPDVVPAGQ